MQMLQLWENGVLIREAPYKYKALYPYTAEQEIKIVSIDQELKIVDKSDANNIHV